MVKIDAAEKAALLKKFPSLTFVRTMKKDSKRHHYYCAEEWHVMEYLRVLRGEEPSKPRQQRKGGKQRNWRRSN